MHKKYVLAVITLFLFTVSHAQQPDTILIDQYNIDEVTISVNKQKEQLVNAPASLTQLSSFHLQLLNYDKLNDLSASIPNLYMPDYGTQLTSPIYLRGIGSRIKEPAVGLYVDGVPYYDKGSFDFQMLDVEKVEVLRGPQGTLYGRNTMGGLISITTKAPEYTRKTELVAEYGNYNAQKYQLSHHQGFGQKLATKLNLQYNSRNGYFNNVYTSKPSDDALSWQGNLQTLYRPNGATKIRAGLNYDRSENQGFAYKSVASDENPDDASVAYDFPSGYLRDMANAFVNIDRDTKTGNFTSITSYQFLKDEHLVDQDFTTADLFQVDQDRKQNLVSQEWRYQADIGRFAFVGGAYGFFSNQDKSVLVDYGSDAASIYHTPPGYNKLKNYRHENLAGALFGQVTWKDLLPSLDMIMGIRWDNEYASMDYGYFRSIEDTEIARQDTLVNAFYQQWMPKITFRYVFPKTGNVYAALSKGYKSGGFNSTFESAADISYEPEHSWNYEIGTRLQFFKKRLKTNLSLFYIDWQNQQIYQPVPSGMGSMITNAGQSKSYGLEVEAGVLLLKNLLFNASWGFTRAEFIDYAYDPEAGLNYRGNFLPYVPAHNASAGLQYRIPLQHELFKSITVAGQYHRRGKLYWNEENDAWQEPYNLFNASIAASTNRFTLRVWANNITNTSYQAFYFEALGNSYFQSGRPRLFGVTLSFNTL